MPIWIQHISKRGFLQPPWSTGCQAGMFSKMSCAPSLRATLQVTNKMRILWSCAQRVVCCRAWTPFDFCPTCSLSPICVAFVSRSCWRKTSRVSVKIYSMLYFQKRGKWETNALFHNAQLQKSLRKKKGIHLMQKFQKQVHGTRKVEIVAGNICLLRQVVQ